MTTFHSTMNTINAERDADVVCLYLDCSIGSASKLEFSNEAAEELRQEAIEKLSQAFQMFERSVCIEESGISSGPDEMDLAKWARAAREVA